MLDLSVPTCLPSGNEMKVEEYTSLPNGSTWLLVQDTMVPLSPATGTAEAHATMEPLRAEVLEKGDVEQSSQTTHDEARVRNNTL